MRPFLARTLRALGLWTGVAAALALPSLAWADPANDSMPGEVLVQLSRADALPALLVKHGLTLRARFGARPIFRLGLVGPGAPRDVAEALELEPAVLQAEPNYVHRSPEARKNVVWAIGSATDFTAQWAPQALRLPEAHRITRGQGVRVAVLDTGVDFFHPALAGRLARGFDFVDFDTDPSEVAGGVASGHGTHVAGLVALAAPGAQIVPLRVLDAQGQGNAWVLAEALLHAVDPDGNAATPDGAHVINMSLGTPARSRILDTVAELAACALPEPGVPDARFADPGYNDDRRRCAGGPGAVVVAAAGNDGSGDVREYPAAESVYGLLAVTASQADRRLATFANWGSWVHVAAPGDGVTSTVPGGVYGTWSGTSMAAPLAAGVAALVRATQPGLSARDITRRIGETASPLCGTALQQVDAAQALVGVRATARECEQRLF